MDLIFNFNTKRKWILGIGQLLFICIGLWFTLDPGKFTYNLLPFEFIVRLIGIFAFSYFGLVFFFCLKTICTKKIALKITEEGVFDNSNYLGMGFIAWDQVRGISQIQKGSVYMIKIELYDEISFIEKESNYFKKFLLNRQNRKFGSPVIIPMIALSAYVDTLEDQLKKIWNQYKQMNQKNKL